MPDSNYRGALSINAGPPEHAVANIPRSEDERAIADVAERLRAAYTRERQQWMSARKGYQTREDLNPRWEKCWNKAAEFVINHSCDPDIFVHAQFQRARLVRPNQLYAAKALQNYTEYVAEYDYVIADRFQAEANTFRAKLFEYQPFLTGRSEHAQWRFILNDTTVTLSPLFRYCLAVDCGFDALITEYQSAALYQYLGNHAAYDEHWGNKIPPRLRALAEQHLTTKGCTR